MDPKSGCFAVLENVYYTFKHPRTLLVSGVFKAVLRHELY
jgi:hypothetical protein